MTIEEDASITCAAVISTTKIVARVLERADPDDSRELARRNAEALKHPDRRIGAAFRTKRRGGDPRAEQRRELHGGIRELASLLGLASGKPAADVAREIVDHCTRYQPLPMETDPVRREMLRVRNAGLPLPTSKRHLVRIISGSDEQ